jgi:hypothetical protein
VCESTGFAVTGSGGAALSIGCAQAHRTVTKTNAVSKAFMGTSNLKRTETRTAAGLFASKFPCQVDSKNVDRIGAKVALKGPPERATVPVDTAIAEMDNTLVSTRQ